MLIIPSYHLFSRELNTRLWTWIYLHSETLLFLLVRSFQLFNTWLYRLKSKHVLPPPSPSVNVEPPSAFIAIKETHFELVGHHLHRSAVHTSACLGTSFWSHCFLWSNCISIMQKQILSPTWWAIGVSHELNLDSYWEHPSGTVHKITWISQR